MAFPPLPAARQTVSPRPESTANTGEQECCVQAANVQGAIGHRVQADLELDGPPAFQMAGSSYKEISAPDIGILHLGAT
jgi:hypothetical protein